MRLIDADALIKEANAEGAYGYVDVAQIANAPIIDAKPVVHAHWEDTLCLITPYDDDDYEEERYKCSNCTMITDFEYPYCPYCGAQMDEFAGDINVGSKKEEASE